MNREEGSGDERGGVGSLVCSGELGMKTQAIVAHPHVSIM